MNFSDLQPSAPLLRSLTRRGYEQPTPVQALILQPENLRRDLLVSAQTGSGKTIAFGLALAAELLEDRESFGPAAAPLGLVIAPTRELALQVQRELSWLLADAHAGVRACVGGMDVRREQRELAAGAHFVVGTPGRLCDHLEHKKLNLSQLRALVLDEADEMLDMGFREELERILRDAPADRRTLLFSATIPKGIAELAGKYQRDAVRLAANPPEEAHQDIEYRAHAIAWREREHAVVNTLRHLEPRGALVFCATRDGVTHLQASLAERGFQAVGISGELTQAERVRALKALRDGQARVLVATDVAARGLDLPALELVLHADLPRDAQVLQHRSGRTGRAGHKGVALVLVPFSKRREAERMFKAASIEMKWSPVATAEQVRAVDQERLVREIASVCEELNEEDLAVARQLLADHSPERLVSALVRQHRSRLPAPEELPETMAGASKPMRDKGPRRELSGPPRASGAPTPRGGRARVEEENGVWFRLNVGRSANADPRWLVPLICRRGKVVKAEIGRIQILNSETRFLIAEESAGRFAAAVRLVDKHDPSIRIEQVRTTGRGAGRREQAPSVPRPPPRAEEAAAELAPARQRKSGSRPDADADERPESKGRVRREAQSARPVPKTQPFSKARAAAGDSREPAERPWKRAAGGYRVARPGGFKGAGELRVTRTGAGASQAPARPRRDEDGAGRPRADKAQAPKRPGDKPAARVDAGRRPGEWRTHRAAGSKGWNEGKKDRARLGAGKRKARS